MGDWSSYEKAKRDAKTAIRKAKKALREARAELERVRRARERVAEIAAMPCEMDATGGHAPENCGPCIARAAMARWEVEARAHLEHTEAR